MAKSITGSYLVKYTPMGETEPVEIDFTPPFR